MFIKNLNDHFPNVKIISSGSSSYYLKEKEFGLGRFIKVNIQPLMLSEFISIRKEEIKDFSKKEIINLFKRNFFFWIMKY